MDKTDRNKLEILRQHLPHLQFITSNPNHAEMACKAGCKWIQLRVKNAGYSSFLNLAGQIKTICDIYNAIFIVNDSIEVAAEVKADGVHLGKMDTPVEQAREKLGDSFIRGGTANTYDDVVHLDSNGADYAGVGPFRFTLTKLFLSPILGEDGYSRIVSKCIESGIKLPLVAVGGIDSDDVKTLFNLGVHGVAVSSAISASPNVGDKTGEFIEAIRRFRDCC